MSERIGWNSNSDFYVIVSLIIIVIIMLATVFKTAFHWHFILHSCQCYNNAGQTNRLASKTTHFPVWSFINQSVRKWKYATLDKIFTVLVYANCLCFSKSCFLIFPNLLDVFEKTVFLCMANKTLFHVLLWSLWVLQCNSGNNKIKKYISPSLWNTGTQSLMKFVMSILIVSMFNYGLFYMLVLP